MRKVAWPHDGSIVLAMKYQIQHTRTGSRLRGMFDLRTARIILKLLNLGIRPPMIPRTDQVVAFLCAIRKKDEVKIVVVEQRP